MVRNFIECFFEISISDVNRYSRVSIWMWRHLLRPAVVFT